MEEKGEQEGCQIVKEEEKRKRKRQDSAKPFAKKPRVISRKKKPGFDSEIMIETSYFFKNGLRYVKPYYFTFTTHAKGRWVGSTVYEVFSKEFQAELPEYYEAAIKSGKVHVNGEVASMSTVIRHNDLLCHRVHRHEPPVSVHSLDVLHSDEELVVINKPSSIPVHPCGRYRHNSILFILAKEHNLKNLHTVHRLDRLTSGLLILAKSLRRAQQLEEEIRERRVVKEYMCRVNGEFPSEPIECDEPILVFSHKLGLSRVDPEGKPCSTHFSCLSYNGTSSLVLCRPKTGRMHQIRVHLQWLGHPIMNDPLYNHPVWRQTAGNSSAAGKDISTEDVTDTSHTHQQQQLGGSESIKSLEEEKGTGNSKMEAIVNEILRSKFEGSSHSRVGTSPQGVPRSSRSSEVESKSESSGGADDLSTSETKRNLELSSKGPEDDVSDGPSIKSEFGIEVDPDCTECRTPHEDPLPSELVMYLHALSYKGKEWSFSAPMPDWADSNFQT